MQWERTVEPAALSGSVRGLGVCDVLQVELMPVQLPQLIEQIDAMRASLEEEIRRRSDAMAPGDARGADWLRAAQYQLHLVDLARERIPAGDVSQPFDFFGPAEMLGALARDATVGAVDTLARLVRDEEARGREARDRLSLASEAAATWVRTLVEVTALEGFSFDRDRDPCLPQ
jgi:hypothetical protein